jgi:hypothetical protein
MFLRIAMISVVVSVLSSGIAAAQAPASAPAGSTGLCNDGTYSSSATKRGACSGHKGVQTWYGASGTSAPAAAPAAAATPAAPAAAPAPAAAAPKETSKPVATQAAGGGPGLVWVNTNSNVYHCPSDPYYGKTKSGAYMSEADAIAKGAHADHGKACK